MKDFKIKIVVAFVIFFHFLIMVGFLDFVPSWKKNVQWINFFLIVINFILIVYLAFRVAKTLWEKSKE